MRALPIAVVACVVAGGLPSSGLCVAAAGKSVAARNQAVRQLDSSGTGFGSSSRLRARESAIDPDPALPPPPLVDAQGTVGYLDRDTRTFELSSPGRRVPVRWTRSTSFNGTELGALPGAAVRVQGHMAEGVLHATVVEVAR